MIVYRTLCGLGSGSKVARNTQAQMAVSRHGGPYISVDIDMHIDMYGSA